MFFSLFFMHVHRFLLPFGPLRPEYEVLRASFEQVADRVLSEDLLPLLRQDLAIYRERLEARQAAPTAPAPPPVAAAPVPSAPVAEVEEEPPFASRPAGREFRLAS